MTEGLIHAPRFYHYFVFNLNINVIDIRCATAMISSNYKLSIFKVIVQCSFLFPFVQKL